VVNLDLGSEKRRAANEKRRATRRLRAGEGTPKTYRRQTSPSSLLWLCLLGLTYVGFVGLIDSDRTNMRAAMVARPLTVVKAEAIAADPAPITYSEDGHKNTLCQRQRITAFGQADDAR